MNDELKSGFKFLSQYVKELSFENPNVPRKLPHVMAKPDINVSVNVNAATLDKGNSIYEVEISTKAISTIDDDVGSCSIAWTSTIAMCCRPV